MDPDLTRGVKVYVSRTGRVDYAEGGSEKEVEIQKSHDGFHLCASVDTQNQLRAIWNNREDWHWHEPKASQHYVRLTKALPDADEIKRIGGLIEEAYRKLKTEKGDIAR